MLRDLQRSTRRAFTDNPFANIGCAGGKGSLTLHQTVRSQRFWLRPALPKALLPCDRKLAPDSMRHFSAQSEKVTHGCDNHPTQPAGWHS
jgi:hypothetical protein